VKEALIGLAILAVIFVIWMVSKTPAKTTIIQAPAPAPAPNPNVALVNALGNAVSSVVTAYNAPDDGDDD
jgi:hypothetical protein